MGDPTDAHLRTPLPSVPRPHWAIRRKLRHLRYRLHLEPARSTTYFGNRFSFPSDSRIGQIIADGGDWDPVLRSISATLLPSGDPVVCDVGSNIGASLMQILASRPSA